MKASILATLAILGIAALLGQRHHERLAAARQENSRLTAEARTLGLNPAALASAKDPAANRPRPSRTHAADREAKARDFAKRLATLMLDMKQRSLEGRPHDEEFQTSLFETLDELLHLDKSQIQVLIAEMRANPALDDEMRSNIIGFAIMTLANDHPAAALALLSESAGLFPEDGGVHVISTAISRWAQTDPAAALQWLRDHEAAHPDADHHRARRGLIEGTARRDPAQAFQLIGTLGVVEGASMASVIAETANTPEERNAVLQAARDHAAALPQDEASNALIAATLGSLGYKAVGDGFEAATRWIETAGLDDKDTQAFVSDINTHLTGPETGRWIEWLGDRLPPEEASEKVGSMVSQWARTDYRAAGEWLLKAPDGPSKNAAIKSYATTVAPHNPDSATQWALTLPAGLERTQTLEHVHRQLLQTDPEAATRFATQHGIEP